ncbi:DUF1049 domain-containing protein [Qipengyuania huizhouensis]|jgi:hypothetical protein|uniref:DUF1049 domain-containing protein n=1 Tax=Qipengyuania huizhouensis TaxID=2867245 RepID=UPI001822A5AD|nr:DUF1049 domain-containing protein [Qipengyuania huizhouensis]MBA4764491.1 DUF1049 domain-containing protein [Erythrobacter sp.]MBX7461340.1 DUF1049 domain-containing protein [Qipengyuania huizhouensis]
MQIVRTILWILLLVGVLAFSFGNWDRQIDVRIWPGIVWDTRVPALVIVSFLLGLVPMWLYHRGVRWRLSRRISGLETATASMAAPKADPTPPAPVRPEPVHKETPAEPDNPVEPEPTTKP